MTEMNVRDPMTTRKRRFLQGALVEGIGMPVTMLLGIVVIPFYFRFIDASQYGYWIALLELIGLLGLFYAGADLYIIQTVAKEGTAGPTATQRNLSAVFVGQFLICLWLILLCYILYYLLPFLNLSPETHNGGDFVYFLLSAWLIVNILGNMVLSIIAGQNNVGLSNFITFCGKTLLQVIPLCFLFFEFQLDSFGYAYVISTILILFIEVVYLRKYIRSRISFGFAKTAELKNAFLFMFRCLFGRAGFYIFNCTDAVIIAKFLATAEVTTYILTMKLGNVFKFIAPKLVNIGLPAYIQILSEKHYERLQAIALIFFRISLRLGLYFASIIFLLNQVFVENWVGEDKYGGVALSVFSGIICIRESVMPIFLNIIFSTEDVRGINAIIFFEAILNLALSIWLVTLWGITGVALATVISTCLFSLSYAVGKATNIIHLDIRRLLDSSVKVILKSVPCIVCIGIGATFLNERFSWSIFVFVLLFSGVVNIIFFEGRNLFEYKNLPMKEIVKRMTENS